MTTMIIKNEIKITRLGPKEVSRIEPNLPPCPLCNAPAEIKTASWTNIDYVQCSKKCGIDTYKFGSPKYNNVSRDEIWEINLKEWMNLPRLPNFVNSIKSIGIMLSQRENGQLTTDTDHESENSDIIGEEGWAICEYAVNSITQKIIILSLFEYNTNGKLIPENKYDTQEILKEIESLIDIAKGN